MSSPDVSFETESEASESQGVWLVVLFLCDGIISIFSDVRERGAQDLEWGDLISSDHNGKKDETAVVLGFGGNEVEARKSSKTYYLRLAKWDNVENASHKAVEMFGYDLSQSQHFQDMEDV